MVKVYFIQFIRRLTTWTEKKERFFFWLEHNLSTIVTWLICPIYLVDIINWIWCIKSCVEARPPPNMYSKLITLFVFLFIDKLVNAKQIGIIDSDIPCIQSGWKWFYISIKINLTRMFALIRFSGTLTLFYAIFYVMNEYKTTVLHSINYRTKSKSIKMLI